MNRETCFWSRARTRAIVVLFAATLACSLSQSTSSNLLLLRPLSGFLSSEATSVSQDGRFVVGNSFNNLSGGPIRATLWEIQDITQQPQPIAIPTPPGITNTVAVDISASGDVVVGYFQRDDGAVGAFYYWTRSERFVELEIGAVALAVSADGRTVVGRTGVRNFGRLPSVALEREGDAVRWKVSESGVERKTLPRFLGGDTAVAAAVSDDGTVAAGAATVRTGPNQFKFRAVRWTNIETEDIGIEDIGTLEGYSQGGVFDCSARGQECVGISFNNPIEFEAFYWQLSSGIGPLDPERRRPTVARRVSGDGLRVVGQLENTAYLWQKRQPDQPAFQATNLNTLIQGPIPLVQLEIAFGISPNAPYVVGRAISELLPELPEDGEGGVIAIEQQRIAFWLDTGFPLIGDVNLDCVIDDADLLLVLFGFGGPGYTNTDLNWDGEIDDADLLLVLFNFGRTC